ncbi:hypothetical protein BD324DRAFT_195473 [Kockovaella imperatae]|uniref:RhoGAP-domain-containing protein n=1 Tax=Kockovaella imperatae TaxID=4999 RepID=A0A1Y1U989_9TREE|nr:hypothetical protein BD324DRAFT_195473 [Kockovaella imperatae]ORX34077.1 hypothetical protein BD324DRAFT_195473 [Kockovaella imperatae]
MSTMTASPLPSHMTNNVTSTPTSSRNRSAPGPPESSPQHGSPRSSSSKDGTLATDVETVLRSHGGDTRKALEGLLTDRSSLQSQNSQLWKLIEKQRGQCASLLSDNDRLRTERDRANGKLLAAGLEPISSKKMSNSSSVTGLGIRAEAPPIRRQLSDREERPKDIQSSSIITRPSPELQDKSSKPSLTVPSPIASSHGSPVERSPIERTASPTEKTYSSPLLPSPMVIQETKLRPQSRMVFPSEVSSWLSLADSPQSRQKDAKQTPPSGLSNMIVSPSTQTNPDRPEPGNGALSRTLQLSADDSQPQSDAETSLQNIPPRGSSIQSPRIQDSPASPVQSTHESFRSTLAEETVPQQAVQEMPQPHPHLIQKSDTPQSVEMEATQELVDSKADEDTPRRHPAPPAPSSSQTLPRISSSLLPHARISIPTSTVYPNASGRDVLCFIISVVIRPPNSQPIAWNVSKLFSAFVDLDAKIKARCGKGRKEWKSMVAPLPDSKAWKDFAPSKIDQRKAALEAYLQSLLVAPISDKTDLCDFLCTDPVQARPTAARKEGYLTKKGKNFGGWKTRYFVLSGPVMEYYESRGGPHLGSIAITNAQIGRQNRPTESSDDRDFRHAFLIIEQTRRGASNRHVLCAESDAERDAWIEVLVRYVEPESTQPPPPPPTHQTNPGPVAQTLSRRKSGSRKNSKDVVITAAAPMGTLSAGGSKFSGAPSPTIFNAMEQKRTVGEASSHNTLNSQGHLNIAQSSSSDQLSTSPSSQSGMDPVSRSSKRQSIMPSRGPPSAPSAAYLSKVANDGLQLPPGYDRDRDRKAKSGRFWHSFGKTNDKVHRPVFGVALSDSLQVASKANLPAIVYRCIEYLEAKKAETEEGIYRLSGSSAVIKGLKDRFDAEGDVNLLKIDDRWDPHAIAGLLKAFLRELPMSLLTLDLHPRFLAVMDIIESSGRVSELSRLVSELPPPNYALLRALTAHLILIVRNSAVNKMTLRNIGIVFSPTLGIPAGIFSEMVTSFGAIFDDEGLEPDVAPSDPPDESMDQEHGTRKRNSMLYQAGGADALLGLGGRSLEPGKSSSRSEADAFIALEDSSSEVSTDNEIESETPSARSEESLNESITTPRAEAYPSPPTVRRPKASSRTIDLSVSVEPSGPMTELGGRSPTHGHHGLPTGPRPPDSAGLAQGAINPV